MVIVTVGASNAWVEMTAWSVLTLDWLPAGSVTWALTLRSTPLAGAVKVTAT